MKRDKAVRDAFTTRDIEQTRAIMNGEYGEKLQRNMTHCSFVNTCRLKVHRVHSGSPFIVPSVDEHPQQAENDEDDGEFLD
jgi:hypothetical protein